MDVRKALLAPFAVLLVAGCTGPGTAASGPATLPPLSSPTASASPSVVPLPPEATPDTAQAAGAFARYYLQVVDAAFRDRDTRLLERLSSPACATCRNFVSTVQGLDDEGLARQGGEVDVRFAEASQDRPGDALVDVQYAQRPSRTVDGEGEVVRESPGRDGGFMQIRLERTGSGWRVAGVEFPAVPQ